MRKAVTEPINLKSTFSAYRSISDPTFADNTRNRYGSADWYRIIPCRYGEIGPAGGDILWLDIPAEHTEAVDRVRESGLCTVTCVYDDGRTKFKFHRDSFAQLAEIVLPERKSHKRKPKTPPLFDIRKKYGKTFEVFRDHATGVDYLSARKGYVQAVGRDTLCFVLYGPEMRGADWYNDRGDLFFDEDTVGWYRIRLKNLGCEIIPSKESHIEFAAYFPSKVFRKIAGIVGCGYTIEGWEKYQAQCERLAKAREARL